MPVRDADAIDAVQMLPFSGYAIRRRALPEVDVDRVAACIALVGAVVLPAIALGRSDRRSAA